MPTDQQAILNSTPVPVEYKKGGTEEISIRQLEITEIYKYIDAIALDETPRIVAYCAGKPIDWVNTLKGASYAKLAKLVHEQNFPLAMEIIQSDPIASARFGKVLAQLNDAAQALLKSSTVSSSAPASPESAAEIRTASSASPSAG